MKYRFYGSYVMPRLLLGGLLLLSAFGLMRAEFGGGNPDTGRVAVITRYYGVTSEEIERIITLPMEDSIAALPEIKELRASSEFSLSRIDISLTSGADKTDFQIRLREKVDRVYNLIIEQNPAIQKPEIVTSSQKQQAVFAVSFSKKGLRAIDLRPFAEKEIKPSFQRIPDLGEITVTGGSVMEVHVSVDTEKAASLGVTGPFIASLLQKSNVRNSAGEINTSNIILPVAIEGRLRTIWELRVLPLKNGIRLQDIAGINYNYRSPETISRLNGEERVSLHIKSSSAKLIGVSRHLRRKTAEWENAGFNSEIIFDQGREIEKSFWNVAAALAAGMLLSALSLIILDGKPGRMVLIIAGQPILTALSLGLIAGAGIRMDPYLLAGLATASGMVLDSALLLTEAIAAQGSDGIKTIKPAIISSTLSTLIALIPVFSLDKEINGIVALTAAMAVMIGLSMLLSIVFIPAFYHRELSAEVTPSIFGTMRNRLKSGVLRITGAALRLNLNYREIRITFPLIAALLLISGLVALINTPVRISAILRQPFIFAQLELAEGESVKSSDEEIKKLSRAFLSIRGTRLVQSTSRRSGGEFSIVFDPEQVSRESLLYSLRDWENSASGGFLYLPEGRGQDSLVLEISVTGPDQSLLKELARKAVSDILSNSWAMEGVLHFKEDPPAVYYLPDRDKMINAGITPLSAARFLNWNLQGPVAGKWMTGSSEIDLRVMASGAESLSLDSLSALSLSGKQPGEVYRLGQLGQFIKTTEPSRINRLNRQHSVGFTIVCEKENPKNLIEKLWVILDRQIIPPGYAFHPSQELIEKQASYKKLWSLLGLTILLIFFLLAIERESLKQALLILMPLPLVLCFPVITLSLTGRSIGSESILGLILLSGMGINNGILILDKIKTAAPLSIEMIESAVHSRYNGLMLTTFTSITGVIPLLFIKETFFVNLGLVLVSGLSGSFIVSLLLFPGLLLVAGKKLRRHQ